MADIVTMAKDELKARGKADAAALAARAVSGEADGQELLDQPEHDPHLAGPGLYRRSGGHPLSAGGDDLQAGAAHDATGNEGWTPDAVPALWAAVSAPGETGTQDDPSPPPGGWSTPTACTTGTRRTT